MVSITAQQILDETKYTTGDITKTKLEYLIDNAIDYINLVAGTSISNMSGVAAAKTVTVTSGQSAVIKPLTILLVRAYVDKGPNVAVGGVAVTTLIADPQYSLFMKLINAGINRLRGRSFERT